MRILNTKSITIALALTFAMGLFSSVTAKQPLEYPFGFNHGMSREAALQELQNLGASLTRNSEAIIMADYKSEYDGISVVSIYMNFFENKLTRVALDSESTTSAEEHRAKLKSVSDYIKSSYKVNRTSNSAPVNAGTDLKKRYICRFQDSKIEILIYSYYDNGAYSLSLNFVSILEY